MFSIIILKHLSVYFEHIKLQYNMVSGGFFYKKL